MKSSNTKGFPKGHYTSDCMWQTEKHTNPLVLCCCSFDWSSREVVPPKMFLPCSVEAGSDLSRTKRLVLESTDFINPSSQGNPRVYGLLNYTVLLFP